MAIDWRKDIEEPEKDPDAEVPYQFDWAAWLGSGVQISTAVWAIDNQPDAAMTLSDDDIINTGTSTIVFVTGGTKGKKYRLRCRVTTNETPPRIDDRTVVIPVREQ